MATMMSSTCRLEEVTDLWTTELSLVAAEIAKAASRFEKEWKEATKQTSEE